MNPSCERVRISDGDVELDRYEGISADGLPARRVDVWVPPGARGPLPVLYMHDGQNLFDPQYSYGGVDWGVDEAVLRLMEAGTLDGVIVVGVWNSAQRWRDYLPWPAGMEQAGPRVKARIERNLGGAPLSALYTDYLAGTVKPFIDAHYPTLPGREHTAVMGSSMGGLISLYTLARHPNVFGGAGCVSTHWPAGGYRLVNALADSLPSPGANRLYFDYGTETLDWNYERYQQRMDRRLVKAGWQAEKDFITRKFEGAAHDEASWRARVDLPLRFLFTGQAGE